MYKIRVWELQRRSMASALFENKAMVVTTGALLLYFLWMDIALFYHVNSQSLSRSANPTPSATAPPSVPQLISPFTGLSVKMMMMDPVNNYIFTPAAQIFNELTGFSSTFSFITPNMVSVAGVAFALAAARLMAMELRAYHLLALALFQARTFCDALDGIVARARIGLVQHVSLRNTSGYVVDGVADALGFAAFLIGVFQFLRVSMPKHKYYLPVSTSDTSCGGKECKEGGGGGLFSTACTQRRVFTVVLCFGLQMAVGAFFWDHYINAYHNLLETNAPTQLQTAAQGDVLRSSITWILMWFWRLSNGHTFIQFLLFAIYINKLWEFLTWIQFVGFAQIFTLAFFTEMHLSTVRNYIMSFS